MMKNSEKNKKNTNRKWPLVVMILTIIVGVVVIIFTLQMVSRVKTPEPYTYQDFAKDLKEQHYESIEIHPSTTVPLGYIKVIYDSANIEEVGSYRVLQVDDTTEITKLLTEQNIPYKTFSPRNQRTILDYLPLIIYFILFGAIIFVMRNQFSVMSQSVGKSAKTEKNTVTFDQIAGLEEEKQELSEVVTFLKSPEAFERTGARMPKGVLMIGPPGTGKTFLAKAVAGEAGTEFMYVSGSEFTEKYVGVGASRVRQLFEKARKNAPCIIFIDEIDAVARKRSSESRGYDEAAQTLNQILVEMDGFAGKEGIVIIAATNREDILDSAITRAGRFDRKVYVNKPDVKGRLAILNIYAKEKPLAEGVILDDIAKNTVGFSGAELENLVNEAAINAAIRHSDKIEMQDFDKAFIKVGVGTEKKSRVVTEQERKVTAYHESGHALLFHYLPEIGPVHMISIVPTGNAGGYTMPLSETDHLYYSRTYLKNSITVMFGGRVAEELCFSDVTTGASNDLEQATGYARAMVTRYGMSDLGYCTYRDDGSEYGFKPYSETTAKEIDREVAEILQECHDRAEEILQAHREELDRCAEVLLAREKLTQEEFEALLPEQDTVPAAL